MEPVTIIPEYQGSEVDAEVHPAGHGAPSVATHVVPEDVQYDGAVKVVTKVVPVSWGARSGADTSKVWIALHLCCRVLLTLWLFESVQAHHPVVAGIQTEIVVRDPMDDLSKVFFHHGLESSDSSCEKCFDSDSGRIRQAKGGDGIAYMVYQLDRSSGYFLMSTYMFNPSCINPSFSFLSAMDEDEDGQPDADWESISAQYQSMHNVMGWETGVFSGNISSCDLLKITFDNDQPAAFRPEVGDVLVLSQGAQTENSHHAVADENDKVAVGVSIEAPSAKGSAGRTYLVYQLDRSSGYFLMSIYMFNPSDVVYPFSFFSALDEDEDGQPDADWESISSEYQSMDSVFGWETGVYSGNISSCDLLKIAFDDDQPDGFRPEVGELTVISPGAQTENSHHAVADDNDEVAKASSVVYTIYSTPAYTVYPVRSPLHTAAVPLVMQADE